MVTIKIKENSKQAKSFLEYAKTLSFVEFVEDGMEKPANEKGHFPNSTTLQSMEKTAKGIGLTKTSSHDDLMAKLN